MVLDANAFISGAGLLSMATTHKLVTTSEVLQELRDPKTR
jgi:rRNA maturation endonuclease Nob1